MKIKKSDKKKETHISLKRRVEELEDSWKRALADYHNLEKRIAKQQQNFVRLANVSLIDKLLGVLDDLERALEHIKDEGLKMVHTQFWDVLSTEGVEEIKAQGEKFDPETMDCVEMVPGPKNKVIKVQLKGYSLNSHVIRPAKVEVGKGK